MLADAAACIARRYGGGSKFLKNSGSQWEMYKAAELYFILFFTSPARGICASEDASQRHDPMLKFVKQS